MRKSLVIACILAVVGPGAQAAEKKLTTDEIKQAFAGNSIHGLWGATEYYSFFDADGSTSYTTKSGTDWGRWAAAHDQYCSKWQMSGESCYDIYRDGDEIIWVLPASGKRYQSTLQAGKAEPKFP